VTLHVTTSTNDSSEFLLVVEYFIFVVRLCTGVEGGRYFFNMVREGDHVMFATEDENESTLWVQAIYRATGQSHKPVPPSTQPSRLSNTQLSKEKGGRSLGIYEYYSNYYPK